MCFGCQWPSSRERLFLVLLVDAGRKLHLLGPSAHKLCVLLLSHSSLSEMGPSLDATSAVLKTETIAEGVE